MIKTIGKGDKMLTKQYQYVIEVAETGNFSKAAENLFMAQSSLSQYIKKLEKELGVTLFDRSTQPVKLTEAGKSYLKTAYDITFLEKQLLNQLETFQQVKKKKIILGITRYWGSLLLPRILPAFQKRYPFIQLEMKEGKTKDLIDWLDNKRIDIAFFTASSQDSQHFSFYEETFLLREEIQLAVSSQLLESYHLSNQKMTPQRMMQLPLLTLRKGQKLRGIFDEFAKEAKDKPTIIMETENITTAYKLASVGTGATLIPEKILELTSPFDEVLHLSFEKPAFWELKAFTLKDSTTNEACDYLMLLAQKAFLI